MPFQIHALPAAPFAPLFDLTDAELRTQNARRERVTQSSGTPCRVSLEDALIGEEVILVNHVHLPEASPFAASHAIYVRKGAPQAILAPGVLPAVFTHRILSLRAFSADHIMQDADLAEGTAIAPTINRLLETPGIAYLHVHYAKPGCFAARVTPIKSSAQ